jgi:hypothetical protein
MRTRNAKLAAVAVVLVAVAAVLAVVLSSSSKPKPLSQGAYLQLFVAATVGKTRYSTVLKTWPKDIYNDFHDGNGNHCLEWFSRPLALYDLCFGKTGILVHKDTP